MARPRGDADSNANDPKRPERVPRRFRSDHRRHHLFPTGALGTTRRCPGEYSHRQVPRQAEYISEIQVA